MREHERDDRVADTGCGDDRLDAELGHALLATRFAESRVCALAAEERPYARRVPGAALVVADPPCARLEHRVARRVERVLGHEPDELDALAHSVLSICARWSVPE